MGDSVREQMTIAAPVADVVEVLLAIERYPEWARDLKAATVLARDDEGRATEARFRAAGFGYSTEYTLSYDHGTPGRLAWVLTEGDVTRKLDGHYDLTDRGDGTTDVVYELEAELVLPLPGFVKRRTAHKITHTALAELKARVEGDAAP
ncbi:SRPBCC family protein [Iamia majanohamensis]|uniref:SRPBCC family protein n=1 Tax=Iamia majanohamensis TaxID=467976 RepID=A0AAF0BQS9_9ACTN|nr:SRPBCC family protein [Iamia majanohamensis]WCO65271.1 SRPBCC family protein [Iamia majanohamensis]